MGRTVGPQVCFNRQTPDVGDTPVLPHAQSRTAEAPPACLRWLILSVAVTLSLAIGVARSEAASTPPDSSADAYVRSAAPATHYRTPPKLRTQGSPTVRSYLRFNVQGLTGP